jgi:acid phosphatase family membrane protein YuiD
MLSMCAAAAAGKQAEVLNQVIGELLDGHPVSDVKLKEVLGHTPLQVRPRDTGTGGGHVR